MCTPLFWGSCRNRFQTPLLKNGRERRVLATLSPGNPSVFFQTRSPFTHMQKNKTTQKTCHRTWHTTTAHYENFAREHMSFCGVRLCGDLRSCAIIYGLKLHFRHIWRKRKPLIFFWIYSGTCIFSMKLKQFCFRSVLIKNCFVFIIQEGKMESMHGHTHRERLSFV